MLLIIYHTLLVTELSWTVAMPPSSSWDCEAILAISVVSVLGVNGAVSSLGMFSTAMLPLLRLRSRESVNPDPTVTPGGENACQQWVLVQVGCQ